MLSFLQDYSSEISAAANVGLLLTAIVSATAAFRSISQAREIERERTRPMMQAHLRIPDRQEKRLEIVISNVGQTIARNVKFEFDPPLPDLTLEEINARFPNNRGPNNRVFKTNPLKHLKYRFIRDPIEVWVPGFEITGGYWTVSGDNDRSTSAEGIPSKSKITITYTDNSPKEKKYKDQFELNAEILFGTVKPPTVLENIQKNLQEIHSEAVSFREAMGFTRVDKKLQKPNETPNTTPRT